MPTKGEKHSFSAGVYTPAEICELFDIARTTLFRWEKEGVMPAVARDKKGNRIYTDKHLKSIGQKVTRRLKELAEQIQFSIGKLGKGDSEEESINLDNLYCEYSYMSYIINRDATRLVELKERAKNGRLPEDIRTRILEYVSRIHPYNESYFDLMDVLYCDSEYKRSLCNIKNKDNL